MKSPRLFQRICSISLLTVVYGSVAILASTALGGCVTHIPVDEWNIARAAYEGARESDAPRFVPSMWFEAEQTYREAQRHFKDRDYEKAKGLFNQAKLYCERAENAARLARHKSGEVVP